MDRSPLSSPEKGHEERKDISPQQMKSPLVPSQPGNLFIVFDLSLYI
jgi:hypothetical protein